MTTASRIADPDEAATNALDPLVPRPIDLPTPVPLDGALDAAAFDVAKILAAPDDPAEWPAWRAAIASLAADARTRLAHDDAAYDALPWASRCRTAAQIWLWDERLYDWRERRFTPDRLLAAYDDVGGLDGLVLWHAYPCIGIDDRNQFDWYRDVPGIERLVADLRRRGVRVFVDYNPWDVGTRRERHADGSPMTDGEALRRTADALGVDGVFLDTLKHADAEFLAWMGAGGGDRRPLALEGESRAPSERLRDHVLSWAQWFADSTAPGVMRARLVERRHMLHAVRRWNRDHAEELQSAWMHGTGVLVWDAVFGAWVGWSARDRSTLRRMARVQRACHDLLEAGEWSPLSGATAEAATVGVYGSTFRLGDVTLVTLVNRTGVDREGAFVPTDVLGGAAWDATAGGEIVDGVVRVPAHGIAGVVVAHGAEPAWLAELVAAAANDPHDADAAFPARDAALVPHEPSTGAAPADAIRIAPGERTQTIEWRRRETGLEGEAPYVEEWKPLPPRLHDVQRIERTVTLGAVAVAAAPVTAGELAAWRGDAPPEQPEAAATHVDLDEARAYARDRGARLPTDAEWREAAAHDGFARPAPTPWEWTETERTDGVTRRVLLVGGSGVAVVGSDWYADGGPQPRERVLAWLRTGLDRSAAIGMRLAWDLDDATACDDAEASA